MEDEEQGLERRINLAVILEKIDGRLGNIEKYQDDCATDRNALFKRIRQVDKQLTVVETKQTGVIKGMWAVGLATLGLIGKFIYKSIHS